MVYVLRVCVGCALCVLCVVFCGVLLCVCVCRYVWCIVVCRCVWCGVVRCGVCCLCVWRGLARGNPSVCRLKKSLRVYRQNARMCSTCARFASTHGCVLILHTETFLTYTRGGGKGGGVVVVVEEGRERGGSLLSLLFSLFLSSVVLFLFSLPALVVSLSSLSNNDNDHSSSRALSVHTRL